MKYVKRLIVLLMIISPMVAIAKPSFDCEKATQFVEILICNDASLSKADSVMSGIYRSAIEHSDSPELIRESQREWLIERNKCKDVLCVQKAYESRKSILTNEKSPRHLYPQTTPVDINESNIHRFSQPYVIEKGAELDVCRSYQLNLNSFNPRVPWSCGIPINNKIAGFEIQPGWRRPYAGLLPTGESIWDITVQMSEIVWEHDVNPVLYFLIDDWPKWTGSKKQLAKTKDDYLDERINVIASYPPYIALFDVDNDGVDEPVYSEQPCGSTFGSRIAVLTSDWKNIDKIKTSKSMPHEPFEHKGRDVFRSFSEGDELNLYANKYGYTAIEDAWHYLHSDAFIYKGNAYFYQWWFDNAEFKGQSDKEAGRLRIYQITDKATSELCIFKFIQ